MRNIIAFLIYLVISPEVFSKVEIATFAGGHFRYLESEFEGLKGVQKVEVGFAGGNLENPTYQSVIANKTDYVCAVQITFDSKMVSFEDLFGIYLRQINPIQENGQFTDLGAAFGAVVFTHSEAQHIIAAQMMDRTEKGKIFESPLKVRLLPATTFVPAEEAHQGFYRKSPFIYHFLRYISGRDQFRRHVWGKMNFAASIQ